jgi:hypothetical protein
MESELENYNTPTIFEETLGPCECPPFLQVCRDLKTLLYLVRYRYGTDKGLDCRL